MHNGMAGEISRKDTLSKKQTQTFKLYPHSTFILV